MQINSTEVQDTFAEAFKVWAARVVITADNEKWALAAARSMTGFATSVIGCKCETGIERQLSPDETIDRRPGVSVILFAFSAEGVGKRLVERIGQSVMTCPTTACYDGLEGGEQSVDVGGKLRFFGDGFQASKIIRGHRLWRIPVMDGEFLVHESFRVQPAVAGGNLVLLGEDVSTTLHAAESAVEAMQQVPGVILPFPGGVVRSGSKPGSKYKALPASTNDAFCPSLRSVAKQTQVPSDVGCVLEIVIDGLNEKTVAEAMRVGVNAAARDGLKQISAGNYGGNLGQFKIQLHHLMEEKA